MSAVEATEARRQRGLAIAALCKITQKNGQWIVPSQTGNGSYRVNLSPSPFVPQCTCPDFAERAQPCKHVFAVQFALQRETNADGTETTTRTITVKETTAKRPTYRQQWPAYDRAQVAEKRHVLGLLADLCRPIPQPPRKPGPDRKPFPLADGVFAAVFKVYENVSSRRFMVDLADGREKGFIGRVPHFTQISDTLENPAVTPILRDLIAESARPLRSVEVDYSVDSSGFTTSRFVRWIDAKYGQPKQEYDWVKCSVMTGVRTNVVTAVEVDERYGGDSPKFAPLFKATASRGFKINEVSADCA